MCCTLPQLFVSILLHDSISCDPAYNADTNAALRECPEIGSYELPHIAHLNFLLPYPVLPDNNSSELPVNLYKLPD
ncbi:hypothetical protein V6Z12_A13G090300 [Gossypium hirsutum]